MTSIDPNTDLKIFIEKIIDENKEIVITGKFNKDKINIINSNKS